MKIEKVVSKASTVRSALCFSQVKRANTNVFLKVKLAPFSPMTLKILVNFSSLEYECLENYNCHSLGVAKLNIVIRTRQKT